MTTLFLTVLVPLITACMGMIATIVAALIGAAAAVVAALIVVWLGRR